MEARADSARLARDTVRAPLAAWPAPPAVGIGRGYRWDREELFASGALTLLELLERIPGITGLRSGWFPSPQVGSYLGDVQRVRVFYDGLELHSMDPRDGNVLDLGMIQLWSLQEVSVERGAAELRVYCQSWSTERTSASTRTDVMTGDEDTNLYRAFYGKRFARGEALQFAAQQYGTEVDRGGGGGDALSVLGRVGWSTARVSADAFVIRTRRNRLTQGSIPGVESERTEAYVRLGAGNAAGGLWAQLVAGSHAYEEISPRDTTDPTDRTPSRAQYVAAIGYSRGGTRLTGTQRVAVYEGSTYWTPSVQLGTEGRFAGLSLLAEGDGPDSTRRLEAIARLSPVPFIALAGAIAQVFDRGDSLLVGGNDPGALVATEAVTHARAEAGLQLGGLWLTGGGLLRGPSTIAPPVLFDSGFQQVREGAVRGAFATARGRIWNALYLDVFGVQWEDAGIYRPRWQTRTEVYLQSRWTSRFPSGHFGILASGRLDHRSSVLFPLGAAVVATEPSRTLTTLLEIRLINAVAFWQFRNILGELYEIVPGYQMPRQGNLYGVRWQFWN